MGIPKKEKHLTNWPITALGIWKKICRSKAMTWKLAGISGADHEWLLK